VDLSVIQDGAEISDWTRMAVTGTAPAGAVSAKAFILHIQTGCGTEGPCKGGTIRWDDISLAQAVVEPSDCVAGIRDGSVTSARIDSLGKKDDIRYGKIVARIKPAVDDAAWGAFWMLGSNYPDNGWPRSGEIDITEVFTGLSNDRTTHSTLHWCPKTDAEEVNDNCFDDRVFEGGQLDTGSSLGDDFHEFEVVWTPERFVFYIDGQQVWSRVIDPNTMEEFNEDFFLILNLAIGGTLGSANQDPAPDGSNWELPQRMLVDWVRVYQAVP
jgi:beta-glucanase (GH16 family)